ncbi:MAG TPA: hypothetical protein VK137_01175, partial [Planctomycetaceae bacterium]|nr:hypothetical protein [Planctomycetaceae bacterium]
RLDVDPSLLVLPEEKVLDQVRLTPELCNQWLKFVAPLLADATQVDGKCSLDLAKGSLPLLSPTSGRLAGTLSVHQAAVRPGALAAEIVSAVEQVRSIIQRRSPRAGNSERVLLEMPAQAVPFQLAEGRVAHQGATFVVSDVVVRTSGSVGLDDSLNLIAEIPIKDEWLGNVKALGSLKGKSVQIPISGTLSKPRMDGQVLANLARQMGRSAVENLLPDPTGGALQKGLDKLFAPKRK